MMDIKPAKQKKIVYPLAAAAVVGSAVFSSCQQQQRLGGVPLPPPDVQPEPVVKPQEKKQTTRPQKLGGKAPAHMHREGDKQPLPGRKRASR